jgi:asparagine synthetase B (glutamine-hydrolysing)
MCGIFFSLSRSNFVVPDNKTQQLLRNRGPDSDSIFQRRASQYYATFFSTVLSLRGNSLVKQPLVDDISGSLLCWNGEAWSVGGSSVTGNDSQSVFRALLDGTRVEPQQDRRSTIEQVVKALSEIRGPFAFIFWDATSDYIYYGRDCLGRRSLLRTSSDDNLTLSSVRDDSTGENWTEVEADGLYLIDLRKPSLAFEHVAQRPQSDWKDGEIYLVGKGAASLELVFIYGLPGCSAIVNQSHLMP